MTEGTDPNGPRRADAPLITDISAQAKSLAALKCVSVIMRWLYLCLVKPARTNCTTCHWNLISMQGLYFADEGFAFSF